MTSSMRSGSTPVRSSSEVKREPQQVGRVPVGQRAAALAEGRPHDVDDDRFSHDVCLLEPVSRPIRSSCSSYVTSGFLRPRPRPTPDAAASSRRAIRLSTAWPGTGRLALVGHAAVIQHDGPGGQLQHPVHLLLDHDQRGAVAVDLLEPLVDLVDDDGRQAQGQLVGHQDLGGHHQHLGQREQALLAAGERAAHLAAPFAEDGEGRVGALEVLLELGRPARWRKASVRFSSTVRLENTPRPSTTWAMPSRAIL